MIVSEFKILEKCVEANSSGAFLVNLQGEILASNQIAKNLLKEMMQSIEDYEGFSSGFDNNILINLANIKSICDESSIEWAIEPILENKYKINAKKIEISGEIIIWLNFILVAEQINKKEDKRIDDVTNNYLANLSHEIRTPLNGIIGFSELMVKKDINQEKQKEYANIIYSNGTHLLKLVSDLLDLSRLEAGKIKLIKTQFSINRLLYDLQLFFLLDMKNRNKEHISFRILPGLPDGSDMITADEMRLKQIIINLVSNAIKFTGKGEISLKYKMIAANLLEFCIADTGRGMEVHELTHVFDRFKQANDSIAKEFGGTGLGLAISKEFVEMHGGNIQVESEMDKGTTFTFTLPVL